MTEFKNRFMASWLCIYVERLFPTHLLAWSYMVLRAFEYWISFARSELCRSRDGGTFAVFRIPSNSRYFSLSWIWSSFSEERSTSFTYSVCCSRICASCALTLFALHCFYSSTFSAFSLEFSIWVFLSSFWSWELSRFCSSSCSLSWTFTARSCFLIWKDTLLFFVSTPSYSSYSVRESCVFSRFWCRRSTYWNILFSSSRYPCWSCLHSWTAC